MRRRKNGSCTERTVHSIPRAFEQRTRIARCKYCAISVFVGTNKTQSHCNIEVRNEFHYLI